MMLSLMMEDLNIFSKNSQNHQSHFSRSYFMEIFRLESFPQNGNNIGLAPGEN